MFNKVKITFLLWLLTAFSVIAQRKEAIEQYIAQYESLAVAEMKRTGVPAAIKLAQGIHETQAGTSTLVQRSNNHFGIKCKTGWSGPSVRHDDDARAECFRKYETPEASYVDHSNFLKNSPRYFALFDLSPSDYQGWAWGLKKAGYATNPQYAQTLIRLIEEYDLNRYSLLAMGQQPAPVTQQPSQPLLQPTKDPVSAASSVAPPVVSEARAIEKKQNPIAPASPSEETTYPSGVFNKEGYRAVWVRAGTPFLAVADQYRIPLSKLFDYNEMEPTLEAKRDQVIFLEKRNASSIRWPLCNKRSR
jgi:Mannosyl-glycoprotein endo-beta-N-acetylglucosaminidase